MIAKKIEIRFPSSVEEKRFIRDRYNVKFIKNEYLGVNKLLYEQYLLGNSEIKFMSSKDFRLFFNNIYLKYNPSLKFIKETSGASITEAINDKEKAFKDFFKGKRGYPKFIKKSRVYDVGVTYRQKSTKYTWKVKNNKIRIPNVGFIILKEKGYLREDEQINNITISQSGNKYYASFLIDDGIEKTQSIKSNLRKIEGVEPNEEDIGADLGLDTYVTVSDGRAYRLDKKRIKKYNKKLKKNDKKRSRQQKKCKKKKVRKNIEKTNKKARVINHKKSMYIEGVIQNIVDDLVKTKPRSITIENLNIQGMMKNKHLSKKIQDSCFYVFRIKLENKCSKLGIKLYLADTFYPSSKRCSCCGEIHTGLRLKDRLFKCPSCGFEANRDLNAAVNLSLIPQAMREYKPRVA